MLHYIIEKGATLRHEVHCFCHAIYYPWGDSRSTVNYLNELKNDDGRYGLEQVAYYERALASALREDFPVLTQMFGVLTVCGVPRAKHESYYTAEKMGLKRAIRSIVCENQWMTDGMDYILRVKDTKTTHLRRSSRFAFGGSGDFPRAGITRETCCLSSAIAGQNILLVDDIYTPGVGTDEDVIQTLFDAGAASVVFYAVGKAQGTMCGYRRVA